MSNALADIEQFQRQITAGLALPEQLTKADFDHARATMQSVTAAMSMFTENVEKLTGDFNKAFNKAFGKMLDSAFQPDDRVLWLDSGMRRQATVLRAVRDSEHALVWIYHLHLDEPVEGHQIVCVRGSVSLRALNAVDNLADLARADAE